VAELALGTKDFQKVVADECGRTPRGPHIQVMEALKVIRPLKTKSGWRIFGPDDVRAAIDYMTKLPPSPRRAKARRKV